jgi:hypothetical protein
MNQTCALRGANQAQHFSFPSENERTTARQNGSTQDAQLSMHFRPFFKRKGQQQD